MMDSGQQITVGNRPNGFHSFPANWKLCSLGEITISSQYGISSSSGGKYCVPILKMNNLQDGHIDLRDLDYISLSKDEMESLMLKKGDLLINRTNSIDLVGKAAVYDLVGEHVFASYLVRFRLGPSVLPAFVNYFLNSEPGQRKLKLLATKAVSQANINPSILKRQLFVPIPPLLEQLRIVEILSALDLSINLTTQLIAKKRDIKQATMQQLLTGKTRLPGFSKEWKVKKLKNECELITKGTTPTSLGKNFSTHGINFIKIESLTDEGYIIWDKLAFIDVETHNLLRRSQLKNKDILFSIAGALGRTALVKHDILPANTNQALALIRLKDQSCLDHLFLTKYLTSPEIIRHIESINVQAAQANLSLEDIRNFEIRVPEIPEQQAIAAVFSDMDAEIASLEQKRDKTRTLKQGMMQELLTGKTRLI